MDAFGITLRDLQQAGGQAPRKTAARKRKPAPAAKKGAARKAARKTSVAKGAKLAVKYKGPKGETWSGRGSMPRWMAELVAAGKSRESFAV